MTIELKDIAEQLNTATTEIKSLRDAQAAEIKKLGEASAETATKLAAAEAKQAEAVAKFNDIDAELKKLADRPSFTASREEAKSWGVQFIESDGFKALNGKEKGFHQIAAEIKDISGVSGSALGAVRADRDNEIYRFIGGRRATRIRDLLPQVPVNSGAVEIMRITTVTDSTAPQQPSSPSTAQGAGELQTKAKSDLVITPVTLAVRTIAHYMIASRQVLADAPMLSNLIDTELRYGLDIESDDQILNGAGTNQSLTGLMVDANIGDIGEIATGTTLANLPGAMINHIRAAITECQTNEYYNINGLVLNPVDWQTLETAKATDGHYLLVAFAATSGEAQSIWRVPVVVSNAMTAGSFLLGDWTLGAKLYVREGAEVRVSESHDTLFVKNGVAVLAEERYCLGISRPKAFCKGSFTVAAS